MRKDKTSFNTSADALYRTILASSLDGLAIVAQNTCFVEVNAAFGSLFDKEPGQIAGMKCAELFVRENAQGQRPCADVNRITKALQARQALAYSELECNFNGPARTIGLSVTPVADSDEGLSLIIARDVTAARAIKQSQASFLSLITHELRSPLNTIHGYLDLALMGLAGELNEQQRDFVERARSSSEHLYALLEDLLFISRADAAQVRLNRDVTDLNELITGALEELEVTISDHAVTLDIAVPADLPPLYVDAVRMQQVLRNLISNALRQTPSGGQVTISASITAPEQSAGDEGADSAACETQKCLKLQVSDSGSGLAAEVLQHVFERFYPPSDRSSSQGLGLAIVKMIVELHGGQVTAASAPGQGSTFTCSLPCVLS
jgi:PAS domain S-box-containing protein